MEILLKKKHYPVYTPLFWIAYFVQMRPYLLFVSGIAGITGLSMSEDPMNTGWKLITAAALFFFSYGFGQALTDCFQTDTDKLSAPYRPLSRDIISIKDVLRVSLFFLVLTGLLFFVMDTLSFILSLAAVFGLATYSYIKKMFGVVGPFYNAWIVALLPLMGFFTMSEHNVFPIKLLPYLIVSFFSYANFVLIGYLKDIEADMATGYKTFPVVFGWNKTVLAGDVFALISVLISWFQPVSNGKELITRIIASAIIVTGQCMAHITKTKNEIGALVPIIATVRGFILLHISIILHFQPGWFLLLLMFYGCFEIALFKRPSKYQV